jgi:hypoxanthine-guanine phosphoribosyltransferase
MKLNIEKYLEGGVYFHPDLIRELHWTTILQFFSITKFQKQKSFGQRKYFIECFKIQSELEENIDVRQALLYQQ